ncbi:heat-shock protein Hsp20 [Halobiforma lacisalsi AJ5]|uniref:Heat-shock protein Hsp20 n=1 Tax=Natronobacterium lacisalsi AJ5 TaxID=358396 RepID=M0LI04_NATLA|nr:Hsp20/alpha crystallin family protein [Halobiforma lacisalsi]APW98483.1 heat-shock protein Hsp20 [Halobiforma lacisalsi AJ5]EMA33262.1 heat shock protein Hsp20 [Halobiforma lacisalsi AJ5]
MATDDNPFKSLERQFERMQRQFEQALETWNVDQLGTPATATERMGIDLADRGDEFVLTADVPGFEKQDIELRLSDDTVHITAKRERETTQESDEADEDMYIRSERERRSLSRSVSLPQPVEEDAVEATYRNGVVTLMLPKRETTEPTGRTIDID